MRVKHDPGPCPVDDAPHTTCTSPNYDPTTGRSTPSIRLMPARDGHRQPKSKQTHGQPPHGVMTTVTYSRAAWMAARKAVQK